MRPVVVSRPLAEQARLLVGMEVARRGPIADAGLWVARRVIGLSPTSESSIKPSVDHPRRGSRWAARFLVAFTVAGLMIECKPDLELDYEQMVLLDAESLAEVGIAEAYEELLPKLRELVSQPAPIEELEDSDTPSYAVRSQGQDYLIYGPDLPDSEGQSWGRATHAFFSIVNTQLETSSHKFYAINAANDLGGMFLTEEECEAARRSLPRREDWPYIPTREAPWFGQFH